MCLAFLFADREFVAAARRSLNLFTRHPALVSPRMLAWLLPCVPDDVAMPTIGAVCSVAA